MGEGYDHGAHHVLHADPAARHESHSRGSARGSGELRDLRTISANVLTQRLEGLEAAGIIGRHRLPSPSNAQVYELTPWGYESETLMKVMGRWA